MTDIKADSSKGFQRRDVLKSGLIALTVPLISQTIASPAFAFGSWGGSKHISFRNQHTGESFSGTYKVGDKYLPEALQQINYVLRDFRTGDVYPMDPKVIDLICSLHRKSGCSRPFEILSGYRSPKTNAMLRSVSDGVAKNSLHMKGQAIDLRLPDYSLAQLRRVAVSMKAGGVGYYPGSDFVHVDIGKIRAW